MVYHPNLTLSPMEQVLATTTDALASSSHQQTSLSASTAWHNVDGSRTLVGPAAGSEGIVQWVGDTTAPGTPSGVDTDSAAGMVLVSWDGTLEGGVPSDFDHVQVLVDGEEAGRMTARGTLALGPYEVGSSHSVSAVAWDDAHDEDGSPAPNSSEPTAPTQIVVSGADIDPEHLGIERTRSETPPQGEGKHRGDLWMQYGTGDKPALVAEWWWDGSGWVPIPVAMYLDQLAARDVQVDAAVIGLLCAGIIRSGSFTTPDGLVGFDKSGFWAKDEDGEMVLQAGSGGMRMTGALETSNGGDRLRISNQYLPTVKRTVGAVEGLHDDTRRWALTGFYSQSTTEVQLSANGHVPAILLHSPVEPDNDSLCLLSQRVEIGAGPITGSHASVAASTVGLYGVENTIVDGPIVENGVPRYEPQRRAFSWASSWQGRPGGPGGQWILETTQPLRVVGPGSGRWFVADMGARIQGPGEYFLLLIVRSAADQSTVASHTMSSSATPGQQADNYTSSRQIFIPKGSYEVSVYSEFFGQVDVIGGTFLAFVDPLVQGSFCRYAFLTQC